MRRQGGWEKLCFSPCPRTEPGTRIELEGRPPSLSPCQAAEGLCPNPGWFFKPWPLTSCFLPFLPGCQTPRHGLLTSGCTCRGMPSSSPQWRELWSMSTITVRPLTMTLLCYSSVQPGLRPWNSSFSQYASLLLARKCTVGRSAGWPAGGEGTKQVCERGERSCPPPLDNTNLHWCSALGLIGVFCICSHLSFLIILRSRMEAVLIISILWRSSFAPKRSKTHHIRGGREGRFWIGQDWRDGMGLFQILLGFPLQKRVPLYSSGSLSPKEGIPFLKEEDTHTTPPHNKPYYVKSEATIWRFVQICPSQGQLAR